MQMKKKVSLLICGCILFTKASYFFNCTGCKEKNGNGNVNCGNYKCEACDRFDHCFKENDQTPVYKVVEKQNIDDCPSGNIAGSVVGGALFGSLVTVLLFMLHRHRQKKSIRNPIPKAIKNPSYQTEMMRINERAVEEDTGKSMYSEINDEKSIKESRVPPLRKNGNIHENKDGVYNTLNETNTVDRSEYYDHARQGATLSTPADGTGVLEYDQARIGVSVSKPSDGYDAVTLENGGNDTPPEDDKSMIEKDISSQEDKTDEYFVLEKIQ